MLELELVLALVLQRELVLVLVLVLELRLVPGLEPVQPWEPRWHRRNQRLLLQVSSWHRASTVRWCRFSTPGRQSRCASCQRFERRLRMRELRWQTTSPLC